MKKMLVVLLVVSLFLALQSPLWAKEKLKIAVMHSLTGSLALAGALAGQRGSLVAIDMWNARGGILNKYEIVPVEADAQSNPDVAMREAERLIRALPAPSARAPARWLARQRQAAARWRFRSIRPARPP